MNESKPQNLKNHGKIDPPFHMVFFTVLVVNLMMAIAFVLKHPNVFAMTAGWAPKYLPEDIVRFAERRNPRKLMWASDYPILPFARTVTEGKAVPLTGDSQTGYLGANARAVFGSPH